MLCRRWSFWRFSFASSLAKTSGLNGSLNFNRCQRMRASLCAMAVMALGLDSFRVTEYVGLYGVCSFGHLGCRGRESPNLWLGGPTHIGSQPTLIPESRHRLRFQQKPH